MSCEEERQLQEYADLCMTLTKGLAEETECAGHPICFGCGNDLTDGIYNESLHDSDCIFLRILLVRKVDKD